ncbi:MAG: hypothetical protein LUQ25_07285 [Methanoregulaceae archaeon]|nr:hypothetical protein [Methanoregulaceae archaeon]
MEKKYLIVIAVLAVVVLAAAAGSLILLDQMSPPKIIRINAQLSGDNGTMIVMTYYTDKPIREQITNDHFYIEIPETGKRLGVRMVPKIGMLASQSVGRTMGWGVIDNGLLEATEYNPVTVVVGDMRIENYMLIPITGPKAGDPRAAPLSMPPPPTIGGGSGEGPVLPV